MADSLEQQALDRVARMYSSYDRRQSRHAPAPEPHTGTDKPPVPPPESSSPPPPEQPKSPTAKPPGLLDALMEDKEQSLVMLLLIMLMKDGADLDTILALMYIII